MASFEERARARADWPVIRYRLGEEPLAPGSDDSTPDQRIAAVAQLTREQWALARLEIPDYRRANMPGRILRPVR